MGADHRSGSMLRRRGLLQIISGDAHACNRKIQIAC